MPLKRAKPPQGRQVCLTSLISLKMLSMSWGRIGFSADGSCNSSMKLRRAIAASTRTGSSLHAATVKPPCKIILGQTTTIVDGFPKCAGFVLWWRYYLQIKTLIRKTLA